MAGEHEIAQGKRELLVAMATGTGKTRTCSRLCYRLLKTGRCRRILFLVDRNALGKQTADALKDLRLENLQMLSPAPEREKRGQRPGAKDARPE